MPKPWEQYSQSPKKPWETYAEPTVEPVIEQPLADEGFLSGLQERGSEIGKIVGGGYPDQSIAEDALQVGGQVAGGGLDVLMEGAGNIASALTPDEIEMPLREMFARGGQKAGEAAMETGLPQQAMEYAGGLMEEYPRATRNLGAVANIVGAVPLVSPVVAGGKMATQGVKEVLGAIKSKAPVTLESLKTAEGVAYKTAIDKASLAGTKVKTQGINNRFTFNVNKAFTNPQIGKLDPDLHPVSTKAIQKISDRFSGKAVEPVDIEHTRRLIGDAIETSKDLGKATPDTVKLYHVMDAFDDSVDAIKPKEFVKGSKEFLADFQDARKISKVRFKTEPLDKIFRDAELAPKGSSYEVSLKNGFRALAKNDRKMKKYTAEEKFLINKAATTGAVEGILNKVGVFSPTSGKLGMAIGGGIGYGAATNPALLALPAAGMAGKAISDKMARGSAQKAMQGIAGQLNPQKSLTERANALYREGGLLAQKKLKEQKGAVKLGDDKVKVYHGTDAEFDDFSDEFLGKSTKANSAKQGHFFTSDKNVAKGYAELANEQKVDDLIERARVAEYKGDYDLHDNLIRQAEKAEASLEETMQVNILERYIDPKNLAEFDAKNARFLDTEENITKFISKAKKDGKKGVKIKNFMDNAGYGDDTISDHYVIFSNKDIKKVEKAIKSTKPKPKKEVK